MKCFCEQKETYNVRVEGEIGADPIWCNICGCNLAFDKLPLSSELKDELMGWIVLYGEWIDWSKDELVPNGLGLLQKHNTIGKELTKKVEKELGEVYAVVFCPATIVENYPRE